jgi:predicted amidohydrolase YtcJ
MQLTATAPMLEGQVKHAAATKIVLAGKLFDPYTLDLLDNQAIMICNDSGMILDVAPFPENGSDLASFDGEVIDLWHLTVLPGFVDTHIHCKRITFISRTQSRLRLPPAVSLLASVCGDLMGGTGYQREHCRAHHQGHIAR